MAYSKEQWARAKFLFELGYSLRDIETDCGITPAPISRKAKSEQWEKATEKQQLKADVIALEEKITTLQVEKATITQRLATLEDFEITILSEKVTEETGIRSLVTSTQSLAMIRANEMLTRGKKTTLMKVGQYDSKGNRSGETYEPFETDLDASDIKNTIEAIDKASITLGINQRHANVNINNTNANQNNNEGQQRQLLFKRINPNDRK